MQPDLLPALQVELNMHVDAILDLLDRSAVEEVELDPLATIVDRLRARGDELDFSGLPPMMQMLLGGMGIE